MPIKLPMIKNRKSSNTYYYSNYSSGYGSDNNSNGKFAIIEGYKIARTNIQFSLSAANENCFAVTSWSKGEGKSTATANLAISFAKMDKKVVLIDCDLRRPNVHNLLKVDNTTGLSAVLCNEKKYTDVIHREVLPNLDVISVGVIPPNPSELVGSDNFKNLLEELKEKYDYVIIDTAPIGIVTDALLVKDLVAGYIIIVREGITTHGDISNFISTCKTAGAKPIGFLKVGCHPGGGKTKKYKRYNKYNSYDYYRYY
ncbi:MAG: CpsD/CapB family tyrosine-protein kinase [Ruminococcus sp.]|nr:CpsD/CapB family tyrosine-protein kinase [Ruminococcus sp.]